MKEIPKAYSPDKIEDKWYKYWEENELFTSHINDELDPFTIVIPPPKYYRNVNNGTYT